MKYYRFVDNAELINDFTETGASAINRKIYKILKDKTFMLESHDLDKTKFRAIDSNGNRLHTDYDFDFLQSEVEKFLIEAEAEGPQTIKLIDWVNHHNLGELSFDKIVKMYNIAVGE